MTRLDGYYKLLPATAVADTDRGFAVERDLDRGLRVEVHDPLWFLARQWMMCEHQGEDSGVPVTVDYVRGERTLSNSHADMPSAATHPIEAIVEGSDADFWTIGRRIRLGAAYRASLPTATEPAEEYLFEGLPTPYDRFNGVAVDGKAVYDDQPSLAIFGNVPKHRPDRFEPSRFDHTEELAVGSATLRVRSRGGRIDWYSAEAQGHFTWENQTRMLTTPEPVQFPGMPRARFWEIEDENVDPSRFGFDRSHLGTGLLIDLYSGVSNEWYGFVWPAKLGTVSGPMEVEVIDTFDDRYPVTPPIDWSLFKVRGIEDPHLLFWAHTAPSVTGEPVETVHFTVDERTGRVWAQEVRIGGRAVATTSGDSPPPEGTTASEFATHVFRPTRGVRDHVHPYIPAGAPGRQLTQGRLAELGGDSPVFTDLPVVRLLGETVPIHEIEAGVVLHHGMDVSRTWRFTRDAAGRPVLWIRRAAGPLVAAIPLHLTFDQVQRR